MCYLNGSSHKAERQTPVLICRWWSSKLSTLHSSRQCATLYTQLDDLYILPGFLTAVRIIYGGILPYSLIYGREEEEKEKRCSGFKLLLHECSLCTTGFCLWPSWNIGPCSSHTIPLKSVVGRTGASKDISILIPRTCEYFSSHGKGELMLHMESRLLWSWL